MRVFSTFENDINLEMAIVTLEKRGINKEHIYAVPLENRKEDIKFFDTIRHSDGTSMMDIGVALATAFSVVGISIGFDLTWGPIYWGIITAAIGFALGVAIRGYTEIVLKKRKRLAKGKISEVILIVSCEKTQWELVENILWEHLAIGVAKV